MKSKSKPINLPFERIAVISTVHITREDGKSLHNAPGRICGDSNSDLFWVPREKKSMEMRAKDWALWWRMSPQFIRIMTLAHEQGISYVKFDPAGDVVKGLEEFEW